MCNYVDKFLELLKISVTINNQKVFKRVIDVAMYIAESITIVVFIYI